MADMCFVCGNRLRSAVTRKPVAGVRRTLPDGHEVRMHKVCARDFDREERERRITAQPKGGSDAK